MCGQQPSCYPIGYQLNSRINCPRSSPCLPCRMKSIKENEGQYLIFWIVFDEEISIGVIGIHIECLVRGNENTGILLGITRGDRCCIRTKNILKGTCSLT